MLKVVGEDRHLKSWTDADHTSVDHVMVALGSLLASQRIISHHFFKAVQTCS